jgi:hypothetical protein
MRRKGGSGWIRTNGSGVSGKGESRSGDLQSPALNHSATLPCQKSRCNSKASAKKLEAGTRIELVWAPLR